MMKSKIFFVILHFVIILLKMYNGKEEENNLKVH